MKITKLAINNFLTVGNARLNLADRGLNIIQGVNDDDTSTTSNGAGKSSVVDALCWALYGVTARGVKGDAVVNRTAKKETCVRVHMEVGATEYIVSRYRKHKEHKNALHLHTRPAGDPGREADDLSKGTDAETQKEVERVLGSSLEVFLASIYAGQEMMPDLPRMTDRELKRLIEEGAGLERIERAYEEARTRRGALNSEIVAITTRMDGIRTRMARDEAALLIKTGEADAWDEARAGRVTAAEGAVFDQTNRLNELAAQLRAAVPAHEARKAELASTQEQLAQHSAIEGDARAAELAAMRAESAIGRALLVEARNTVAIIEGQIANADVEMAKPCDECGKPHTEDEKAEYIAHRTKRLADARENLKLVEAKVREQAVEAKRMRDLAYEARAKVPDVSAVTARRAELQSEESAFERLKLQVQNAKRDVEAVTITLTARKTEVNPGTAVVEQLRRQIADDTAALAAAQEQLQASQRKVDVADAVVKVFGPAGVRAQILDTVTPFLNARTADYLSALSDGAITAVWSTLSKSASGDLKEKFAIEVSNATGGDSFLALSGGEKRKVRLATALALQDLVASRASQPIDLWIGDEVDDALDPAGLERLMIILERKARERGTVLIISHNSLGDWCDQATIVRKKGGYSTLEGTLCD